MLRSFGEQILLRVYQIRLKLTAVFKLLHNSKKWVKEILNCAKTVRGGNELLAQHEFTRTYGHNECTRTHMHTLRQSVDEMNNLCHVNVVG